MKSLVRAIIAACFGIALIFVISVRGYPLEKEKSPIAPMQKAPSSIQPSPYQKSTPSFPDAGGEGTYDPGIDLVVTKVEMERGIFQGAQKIRIIPTIKNMWKGRTSARIKIMFYTLDMAEWVEGGIGPNQEIRAGAIYINDPTGRRSLSFSVMVDSDNAIPENNDMNNRCENVVIGASETSRIHNCPVVGPHEPLI